MTVAPLNPFTSQTVSSLRKIEPPIRWLNDAALRKLMAVFEVVEEKPHRCELVQLILSRGDGYGKSHLLGRLIKELDGRATCVSVADYHDPLTCWVTLLQSILNELSQPELIHHLPYPPTQLDELAHQLFGFLTAMLADKGVTDTPIPGDNRDDLLERPFEKWDLSDPASTLGIWVKETLTACEQDATREATLVRLLKAATMHAYNDDASAMNWLLVLHRYASDRADEESRQMCLEWILTNQLEVPAETFLQNEAQLAGNNLIARQQTLDLLALAKLYRPFLLCFDQTSSLTSGLAKSFGNMLVDLVRGEGAHFSIVTANSNLWETTILPELAPDCLPCLATKMELAGLTREQGRSLAEQRLQSNGDPVELQERFFKKGWLEEQFAQGSLGQRDFLQRCEIRYQEIVPDAVKPSDEAETTAADSIPFEPLIQDVIPTVPAPAPIEPEATAPSTKSEPVSLDDLPPIPAMGIAEAEPIQQAPPESPVVSAESVQIPPPSIIQSSTTAESIDTSNTSTIIPVESVPQKSDANNTGSKIPTSLVIEPPAPAEIVDTVNESTTAPFEAPRKEQESENTASETPELLNQVSTPVLEIEKSPLPEQASLEEVSPAPIAPLSNNFSAFTPLIEIAETQTEERKESYLPPVLLPPAQEEFLSESVEASNVSDSDNPAVTIQELAKSLAEPEKTIPEETPKTITSPVIEVEPAPPVPANLAPDLAPAIIPDVTSTVEVIEPIAPTPVVEGGAIESQPVLEAPQETIPEISADSTGQIQSVPLIDEVEKTISPAPLVAVESFINPAPEVVEDTPVVEDGALESQPMPEASQETISADSSGQIQNVPSVDEVDKTISSAPLVIEESFINATPEVVVSPPSEFEPKIIEAVPGILEVYGDTRAVEPSEPSEIAAIDEPTSPVAEVLTPVVDDTNPVISEPAPIVPVDDQAELRDALFQIIKAHRFASHIAIADELRRKMQRTVSVEETILCAESISEIHVYADGPNAAFLWQGVD